MKEVKGASRRCFQSGGQSPVRVNLVILAVHRPLPVDPYQQTFSESVGMPQRCDLMLKDAPWPQVDTMFSRAAGGAFLSSLPKIRNDGTTGETLNLCFIRLTRQ